MGGGSREIERPWRVGYRSFCVGLSEGSGFHPEGRRGALSDWPFLVFGLAAVQEMDHRVGRRE